MDAWLPEAAPWIAFEAAAWAGTLRAVDSASGGNCLLLASSSSHGIVAAEASGLGAEVVGAIQLTMGGRLLRG